jgi:hypothetical protein
MPVLNLGNSVHEPIRELRGNADFRRFLDAYGEKVWDYIFSAMQAPAEQKVEQVAYAKALYDMWVMLTAEITGTPQNRVRQSPVPLEKMRQ